MKNVYFSLLPCALLSLALPPIMCGQFQQMPGMPAHAIGGGPGFGAPGLGGPQFGPQGPMAAGPGAFPMPSEDEFMQAMRELENMSPEEIAAAERMGQMVIASMSDEEFAMISPMFEAMGLKPADVREEARRAAASDFEMPTPQPPSPAAGAEEPTMPQPQPSPKAEAQKPAKATVAQTKDIVKNLITALIALQQKADRVREVHETVRAWVQELRDLMFYLRVMDKHAYHEHLSLPQFKPLLTVLSTLSTSMTTELPDIALPDDLIEEQNPYEVLNIKISASQQQVDNAYENLSERYDAAKLRTKLAKEGLSEKDIKRELKAAKIAADIVEEAYDAIKEPKTRQQVDRDIKTRKQIRKQKIERANRALKNITQALSSAIYDNDLFGLLEQFFTSYAPQQLAFKKEAEEAEKKRLEEQKTLGSLTPSKTSGPFEPELSQSRGFNDYGYYSDFNPYYYDGRNYPDYSYGSPYDDYDQSTSSEKEKAKDFAGAAGEGAGTSSDKRKEATPEKPGSDSRTVDELITALTNDLGEFTKAAQAPANKTTIADFGTYARQKRKKPASALDQPKDKEAAEARKLFETLPTEVDSSFFTTKSDKETPKATETRATSKIADIEEPTPVEASRTVTLKHLRSALKLESLSKNAEALLSKLRQSAAPTSAQKKIFFKLIEEMNKQAKPIKQLQDDLSKLMSDMPDDKKKEHGPTIEAMTSDIGTFTSTLNRINDRYFDIPLQPEAKATGKESGAKDEKKMTAKPTAELQEEMDE